MAKENKKVEETKVEEPKKPEVTKVDLKKKAQELKSNVTKIDLNKPLSEGEDVEKQSTDDDVIVVNEEPRVEEPTEKATDLNIARGSIGSLILRSQNIKATNSATVKTNPATINGDVHPNSCANEIASITDNRNNAERTVPVQSNFASIRILLP